MIEANVDAIISRGDVEISAASAIPRLLRQLKRVREDWEVELTVQQRRDIYDLVGSLSVMCDTARTRVNEALDATTPIPEEEW